MLAPVKHAPRLSGQLSRRIAAPIPRLQRQEQAPNLLRFWCLIVTA
jgi:hypothetical protein